jgi:nucleotide-binding universal stress UspA family protein
VAVFRNILIPTDGSKLSLKGAKAGVKLARALGARVTALYVVPPYVPAMYGETALYIPAVAPKEYKKASERAAKKALAAVETEAQTARVPCAGVFVTDRQPWGGILRVARSKRCDAIVMASHGRGALGGLILGSETQRVLAHSKIPVLVTR